MQAPLSGLLSSLVVSLMKLARANEGCPLGAVSTRPLKGDEQSTQGNHWQSISFSLIRPMTWAGLWTQASEYAGPK
ncbi:hypothetical protein F5148DRAFT_1217960 [Russula earlei]|uniref:Uncharacterized protein n=1 Tax=Russula earlei TaxID=71964 RepID=A0ACC0U562_9AGAM|nr:hypothetical protein F5148DRAFT_1217960 [Russula earlei]